MDKDKFTLIIDSITNRITQCKKAFNKVKTTDDLLKLTLEEVIALKKFCETEYEDMTKIAMVDFYHIIGMGDLTPPQMTKFTFAMRDYLNYRPDITNIKANLDSITKLPQLPTKTKFKLLALCDLTLTKNVRPDEEDEVDYEDVETVSTYTDLKAQATEPQIHHDCLVTTTPTFEIRGMSIIVKKEDIESFFNQIAPQQAYYGRFLHKVQQGGDALGIHWLKTTSSAVNYVGTLKQNQKDALIKKFNL